MTKEEAIKKIAVVLAQPDDSGKSELTGVFQAFRPNGEGAEEALGSLAFGKILLPRLKEIYQATAGGYNSRDIYFIVSEPPSTTEQEAMEYARSFIARMSEVCVSLEDRELASILNGIKYRFVSDPKEMERGGNDDYPEVWLNDAVADYTFGLERLYSVAHRLNDAFYSIANDSFLRHYLMWPLYKEADVQEPFTSYFWLWCHGVQISVNSEDECLLWLPPKSDCGA